MDQLSPSLVELLAPLRECFRSQVFNTFTLMTVCWVVCLGRHTISRVWQTTGLADTHDHNAAYRLFSEAVWNCDEVMRLFLLQLFALVSAGTVFLIVDDTLCHKRGAKVAFGGIFLDAVLSTKKHKTLRYGVNWVTLGLALELPFRKGHYFCVNILWRVYRKKEGKKDPAHKTKSQLAREMVDLVACWFPERQFLVIGDSAYMGKYLLKGLPDNVDALGPIHWKAKLTAPLDANAHPNRKKGEPLFSPLEQFEDAPTGWDDLVLNHPKGTKNLQVQVIKEVRWYGSAGDRALQVVLVRDPQGKWRNEALLCTTLNLSAEEVILAYMRRWSVEVCYCQSKQMLGLHDPQVWCGNSVERAHPMAWFTGALVLLWYARVGVEQEQAHWQRPWYKQKKGIAFADMLACCRLHLWRHWLSSDNGVSQQEKLDWLLHYMATTL